MTIGEKIKKERIRRGMTQAALGKDIVTRNMICRLEADAVSPSLQTLSLIARRLEIPAAYFLSDDEDPFLYIKEENIGRIRRAFAKQNYALALKLLRALPGEDDETAYLCAICLLELGMKATDNGTLRTAKNLLTEAIETCRRTSYPTERVSLLAPLYLSIADNISAPLLEFDEAAFASLLSDVSQYEFFRYVVQDTAYSYADPLLARHTEAKKLMRAHRYIDAQKALADIEDSFSSVGYRAYVMYTVYLDLEQCCKQLGDFESAYRYSTKRLSLLEGFKS